ncbi:slit homolog 3 protein isoform X2 [Bacillus rossius redtenbacheri]
MLLVILSFVFLQPHVLAQIRHGCNVTRESDDIVVTCDRLSLQEVPPDLPGNITKLSLSFNQLTGLTDQLITNDCGLTHNISQWCSRFPNMTYLDFSYNTIKKISLYSFTDMVFLSTIDLGNNKIEDLPSHIFSSNRFLVYIDVSGNNIKFIHPEVFKNLHYLRSLYISNNHIVDFQPETFDGLLSLRSLFLNNNSISRLSPELFKNLSNLKYFNVDRNRLQCIAQEIFEQLLHLKTLKASNNQIKLLSPAIFSNNLNLEYVDFSHNLVWKLSKYTFLDLIKMIEIDFSFNRFEWLYLSYLPVSFKSHNKIKMLDMDTGICLNQIGVKKPCFSSIDNILKGKQKFHYINFSHNNIRTIKYSDTKFFHSLELANISFAGNYDLNLEVSFFRKERFIIYLNLDRTNLNWKNFTLINEMLELPYLKILSVVGSGVCESYTKHVLSSIFNPNKRINVICDRHMSKDLLTNTEMLKNTGGSYIIEHRNEAGFLNSTENVNITKCLEDGASYNASILCSFECECYENSSVKLKKLDAFRFQHSCAYTLDCSYYSFTALPVIESNFSCIFFSHNNIKRIEDKYFKLFYKTRILDLSYNLLIDLPDEVFNPLISLEVLYLDNNNLTSLNPVLFKHLRNLERLTLHGNSISSYNAHAFSNASRLNFMSIDFANLENLHDVTFQNLSYLRYLIMRENTIKAGPKNIVNAAFLKNLCAVQSLSAVGFNLSGSFNGSVLCSKSLKHLYLEGNYLPVLTDDIFRGHGDLVNILLPNNDIQSLGNYAFRNLTKISLMDLSYNSIKVLPRCVFSGLQQLSNLKLAHNKISCVSTAMFQNLTMLRILDLSYNDIAGIDPSIFSMLNHLRVLFLNSNNITIGGGTYSLNECKKICLHIDRLGTILKLNINVTDSEYMTQRKPNIEVISISNNAFQIIDDTMFNNNRFVKRIRASYNRIRQIHNDTFKNTRELEKLELDSNELVVISKSLFKNLTRLQFLALHRNRLEYIEHGAFTSLKSLEYLYLSHNRLKTFDLTYFPGFLKLIALRNNYITINISRPLENRFLETIFFGYNPLTNAVANELLSLPSLNNLQLQNTNVHEFSADAFKNTTRLTILNLTASCVHSLSGRHFHNLRKLLVLDMSRPRTHGCAPGTDNVLSWKNITLINSWFEHPYLQHLILTGHDICKDWNQVIDDVFLSETWKIVVCSEEAEPPGNFLSSDGRLFLSTTYTYW